MNVVTWFFQVLLVFLTKHPPPCRPPRPALFGDISSRFLTCCQLHVMSGKFQVFLRSCRHALQLISAPPLRHSSTHTTDPQTHSSSLLYILLSGWHFSPFVLQNRKHKNMIIIFVGVAVCICICICCCILLTSDCNLFSCCNDFPLQFLKISASFVSDLPLRYFLT